MIISAKDLRPQIENGEHACGGGRVMLPTETVVALLDELDRLHDIVINAQAAAFSFAETVRSAVEAHKRRGQGGQQVSFHGDFANATPSVLSRLEWWVRHLSLFVVQTGEKPEAVRERDQLAGLLSTRDAEIAGMRKENERLQAVVEAAENVVAENSTRINHARASKAMVNLYHLIASMPNIEVEGSSAWRSGITASLRCVRYRQSVMPDLQTPAYKQALADIALHLMAMLERNSEKSTTQLAAIDALAPATKEG